MLRRLEMAEGGQAVLEGKNPVDHRFDPVRGERAVQIKEHRSRADIDAGDGDHLMQDRPDLEIARDAGKHADEAHPPAIPRGPEGLGERPSAPNLEG
jgi:hypothetical protein